MTSINHKQISYEDFRLSSIIDLLQARRMIEDVLYHRSEGKYKTHEQLSELVGKMNIKEKYK